MYAGNFPLEVSDHLGASAWLAASVGDTLLWFAGLRREFFAPEYF